MKIKLDENLPACLIEGLDKLGHDVDSVPQEALSGQPDTKVWDASQEAGRFLITSGRVESERHRCISQSTPIFNIHWTARRNASNQLKSTARPGAVKSRAFHSI
jgi:predicted nuclease of predicted toxin-antitoxin system